MSNENFAYIQIPVTEISDSTSLNIPQGTNRYVCNANKDIDLSITGQDVTFETSIINLNAQYTVSITFSGDLAVLEQYDALQLIKPRANSGSIIVKNPIIGI